VTSEELKKSQKGSWLKNTLLRIASAAVLIPVLFWLLFWAPKWGFVAFALVALGIASRELFLMVLPNHRAQQWVGTLCSLSVAAGVIYAPRSDTVLFSLLGISLVGLIAGLARPEPVDGADRRLAWLVAGPIYVGGMLSTLILLHLQPEGGRWVILAMIFAFGSDTAAYFAGKLFGRHRLYPIVSPNKTVEGAVGGILGGVLGALAAHYWFLPALPLIDGVVLAILAAGVGQLGDLCVSLIKRSRGVKDSGAILPGHGGLLDRVDALAFTSVITWGYYALYLVPPA